MGGAQRHLLPQVGPEEAVEALGFEIDHRVLVPDGGDHQSLGVGRGCRRHDLPPGRAQEPHLRALAVVGAASQQHIHGARGAPERQPHHQRHRAPPPPIDFGGIVHQGVEARRQEIGELHLQHRAQAQERRAHPAADDGRLGERRVEAPLGAKLLGEPAGHSEGAAVAATHVLPQDEDPVNLLHHLVDSAPHGLVVGHSPGLGRCGRRRHGQHPWRVHLLPVVPGLGPGGRSGLSGGGFDRLAHPLPKVPTLVAAQDAQPLQPRLVEVDGVHLLPRPALFLKLVAG